MATTAALVSQGPNHLRYLVTYTGAGGTAATIPSTGGATPDLLTDSVAGPLKNLAKVVANGFGTFAAGVQTQVKARALWLSDRLGANPGISIADVALTTAIAKLTPHVSAGGLQWTLDANIDGGGVPTLVVSMVSLAGTAGTVYLDIEVPQAIGY